MPVFVEEGTGSGGSGRGARAVDSLPDISTVRPGDIFILTEDDGEYESGDFVYVIEAPVAAAPGSITKEVVTDSDFRTGGNPTSQILNYVGAVTTQPATPAAGTQNWFWDLTSARNIGENPNAPAGRFLKLVHSDGVVYSSPLSPTLFLGNGELLWFGDPNVGSNSSPPTRYGDATLNSEAAIISFLDANETEREAVQTALAVGSDDIVTFEIANDDLYKITGYTPGTAEGTENKYSLIGADSLEFVDNFPDESSAVEGRIYIRRSDNAHATLKVTPAAPESYTTETFDSNDDADFLGIVSDPGTFATGSSTDYIFSTDDTTIAPIIPEYNLQRVTGGNWSTIPSSLVDTFLPADYVWLGDTAGSGVENSIGAGSFLNEAAAVAVFTDEPGLRTYDQVPTRTRQMLTYDSTKTYLYHDVTLGEMRIITGLVAATDEVREVVEIGGTGAFGGVATLGAQAAKTSGLNVYLFSPIVEAHEALDWELKGITRLATNATKDIYTNVAKTQGIRVTLSDPAGADGNAWRFVRGVATGTPVISRVVAGDEFRLDGTIPAGYLTSALKALIDVLPQLSSVYFGGETGTTTLFDTLSTEQVFGDPLLEEDHFTGGADALDHSIVVDDTNNEVILYTLATETLGEIATLIEAIDGLAYAYFGGADATTVAARPTPWTEDFDLLTIVSGPAGPAGADADTATIDARIATYARITPSGTIALAQLPSGVMLDSEFTAAAVRTLLGLSASQIDNIVVDVTATGQVITVTKADGTTNTINIPSGAGATTHIQTGTAPYTTGLITVTTSETVSVGDVLIFSPSNITGSANLSIQISGEASSVILLRRDEFQAGANELSSEFWYTAFRTADHFILTSNLHDLPNLVSQSEAEAGTNVGLRSWSPQRVSQAIAALATGGGGGGGGADTFLDLTDTPAAFGTVGQIPAINSAGDSLEFVSQIGAVASSTALLTDSPHTSNTVAHTVPNWRDYPSLGLVYFDNSDTAIPRYFTSVNTRILDLVGSFAVPLEKRAQLIIARTTGSDVITLTANTTSTDLAPAASDTFSFYGINNGKGDKGDPGTGGGASAFADLTGMIADSQVPAAFTRDAELSLYALLANAIGVSDLPSDVQSAVNAFTYTTASPQTLSYTEVDGGVSAVVLSGLAALAGATFSGALILHGTPTQDNEAATKAYVDSVASGTTPPTPAQELIYFGQTSDVTQSALQALDVSTLMSADATVAGHDVTIGPTIANNHLVFLFPTAHPILSLINSAGNNDELPAYTHISGVRSDLGSPTESYDARTFGPLNAGLTVNYRLTLQE